MSHGHLNLFLFINKYNYINFAFYNFDSTMTVFSDENINTLIYIYTSRYSLSLTDLLVNMAAMTRDVTIPTM